MREIKYKALVESDMVDIVSIDFFEDGQCVIGFKTIGGQKRHARVGQEDLRQFTGLKDRNGVSVFEGDIVGSLGDKFCKVGQVKEIDGRWMVSGSENLHFNLHWYLDEVEVIGNIHEHSHLLEGDQ